MKFPSQLYYTSAHCWLHLADDGNWIVGITDYAQDLLGDIVYIEPPKPGINLTNGEPCGIVESVKTGSDLHAPMDGTVIAINELLQGTPESINDKPYDAWIFKFKSANNDEIAHLLTAEQYQKLINEA